MTVNKAVVQQTLSKSLLGNPEKPMQCTKGAWELHPKTIHVGTEDKTDWVDLDKVCRVWMWEACLAEKATLPRVEAFADTEPRLAENTHGQEQGNCGHFWCAYNFKVMAWISTGKYHHGMTLLAWTLVWMMLWYYRYLNNEINKKGFLVLRSKNSLSKLYSQIIDTMCYATDPCSQISGHVLLLLVPMKLCPVWKSRGFI